MKTWQPDTCKCVVEEIYPENPGDPITGGQVLFKCEAHADVPDEELYGVLYANPDGENKRKNLMHRALLGHDTVKGLGLEQRKQRPDGTEVTELKDGVEFDWSFEGQGKNRVLKVNVKGANLTSPQKAALRDLSEAKFGANKVSIL